MRVKFDNTSVTEIKSIDFTQWYNLNDNNFGISITIVESGVEHTGDYDGEIDCSGFNDLEEAVQWVENITNEIFETGRLDLTEQKRKEYRIILD